MRILFSRFIYILTLVLISKSLISQIFNYEEYNFRGDFGWQTKENRELMKANKVKTLYEYAVSKTKQYRVDSILIWTFKFDSNGNLIEEYELERDKETQKVDTFKILYKYDTKNNVIYKKYSHTKDHSEIEEHHSNFYDKQGRLKVHVIPFPPPSYKHDDTLRYYYNNEGLLSQIYRPYDLRYRYFEYKDKVLIKKKFVQKNYPYDWIDIKTYNYNAERTQITKENFTSTSGGQQERTSRIYKLDKEGRIIEEYLSYDLSKTFAKYKYSNKGLIVYREWMSDKFSYVYECR